jgi:hypothetical protein
MLRPFGRALCWITGVARGRSKSNRPRMTPSFDLLPSAVGGSRALLGRALSQNPRNVFGEGDRDDGDCDGNSHLFYDGHAENGPRSCTTTRLRCSLLSPNVRTAAASAASRFGASTSPRTWARLRISDTRQLRCRMVGLFFSADFRVRECDDIAGYCQPVTRSARSGRSFPSSAGCVPIRFRGPLKSVH